MEPTRRLVRRRDDRILGGVCSGIADHFGLDPTIVRVAAAALTLLGGAGVLLYLVAWVIIPEEGSEHRPFGSRSPRHRARSIVGLVLIAIALTSISHTLWPIGDLGVPVFLIALGIFLLWSQAPGTDTDDDLDAPRAPATAPPTAAPSSTPPSPAEPAWAVAAPVVPLAADATTSSAAEPTAPLTTAVATDPTTQTDPTVPLDALGGVDAADAGATATAGTSAREWHQEWRRQQRAMAARSRAEQQRNAAAWRRRRRARQRSRRSLTIPTLGVLAIGAGVTGIALAAGASVDAASVLAIGLVIVGAALVLATVLGRAGGLVPLGLVLLSALTAVSALSVPLAGGIGRRTVLPTSVADLQPRYHLAIGRLEVGLGSIRPPSGSVQRVEATVGIGQLVVAVPRGVEVALRVHADLGGVRYAGIDDGGWQLDATTVLHRGAEGAGRIELDAEVGIGAVEVRDA